MQAVVFPTAPSPAPAPATGGTAPQTPVTADGGFDKIMRDLAAADDATPPLPAEPIETLDKGVSPQSDAAPGAAQLAAAEPLPEVLAPDIAGLTDLMRLLMPDPALAGPVPAIPLAAIEQTVAPTPPPIQGVPAQPLLPDGWAAPAPPNGEGVVVPIAPAADPPATVSPPQPSVAGGTPPLPVPSKSAVPPQGDAATPKPAASGPQQTANPTVPPVADLPVAPASAPQGPPSGSPAPIIAAATVQVAHQAQGAALAVATAHPARSAVPAAFEFRTVPQHDAVDDGPPQPDSAADPHLKPPPPHAADAAPPTPAAADVHGVAADLPDPAFLPPLLPPAEMDGTLAAAPLFAPVASASGQLAPTAPGTAIAPQALSTPLADLLARRIDGPVELTLSPEELGRVRLSLAPDGDGLTVIVHVERADTLDLLRRNADLLLTEIRAQGFSGASLSFAGWAGGQSSAQPQAEGAPASAGPATPFAPEPPPNPASHGPAGGLDLRL